MSDEMDHRELLKKYMTEVTAASGHHYLPHIDEEPIGTFDRFDVEELYAVLTEITNENYYEDYGE